MTQDEIIEMAREASFTNHSTFKKCLVCNPDSLLHFANLVAAKEREALAQTEQDGECKYCTDGCPACDARKLPPQRTWVGLTDEDISEIVRGTHNTGSFVRAIEAKLKGLNT